ncbi:uncharacterized protein LOC107265610 isoform X2 [Cephus cinctus]|uniref:NADH dehydrogenase [ubiquinone] 1 alpha subcomplex subunit 11 n=1 Tax=Cephus cinctus TaxID=211228 RepID=A0AAJ7FGI5_CEPCN|nr:uncharacterized protein LOC107265610 isoform X2 [Cephus cinctus]XP_024938658.1 uncharacterized protein LOC107265610 isoform X2 [Cephus cinctus]
MYKILQYKYTDTPDGKDGIKKMFYTSYIVPAVGFTAAYTATIYMATNLRGKDDCWNYTFAALVTAGVVGIARKNMSDAGALLPILTLLSFAYKRGTQHGTNIFNPKIVREGRVYYRDLSQTTDYPKNYTKSS